jgi:hypothetical protein
MNQKFLVETDEGLLNIHSVDKIYRDEEIIWQEYNHEQNQVLGKKVWSLVALRQGLEIHRWNFQTEQERESAVITLRKEFEPLKIQFR